MDTQVWEIHYFFDIRVIRKNKANYLKKPLSHTYRLVVRLILKMFRSYLNHTFLYRRAEVMKDVVVEILIDLKSQPLILCVFYLYAFIYVFFYLYAFFYVFFIYKYVSFHLFFHK